MINPKEVQHISRLARLDITEEEKNNFTKELSLILDYAEKLKEVDVSNVSPTEHPHFLENVLREDEPKREDIDVQQKIMEDIPETKNGYLKTKPIL